MHVTKHYGDRKKHYLSVTVVVYAMKVKYKTHALYGKLFAAY